MGSKGYSGGDYQLGYRGYRGYRLLCGVLAGMAEDASAGQRASLPAAVASPGARVRIPDLVKAWDSAPGVSPTNLAWALRAASDADELRRTEHRPSILSGPAHHPKAPC